MDYYQNNQSTYRPPEKNLFATVSCALGIASLATMCTGILSIPLGALGILFAVLSRTTRKMPPASRLGCGTSAAGLIGGLIFTIAVYVATIFAATSQLQSMDLENMDSTEVMNYMMESIYGPEYEAIFQNYGIDYDSLLDQLNEPR